MSHSLTFDVVTSPHVSPYSGILFRVWELVLSVAGSLNSQQRDTHRNCTSRILLLDNGGCGLH